MASYKPCLFDCFPAEGCEEEISDNDPEFLPEDRFSDCDSSDDINLRNVSISSRLSTSKSRPKDKKRSQSDNTHSRSDSRPKNREVQEQLEQLYLEWE